MAWIAVLVTLATGGLVYGLALTALAGRWHLMARIERHAVRPWQRDVGAEGRAARQAVRSRPRTGGRARPSGPLSERLHRFIEQSGVPLRPNEFVLLTVVGGVAGAVLVWAIFRDAPAVLVGMAACLLPWALVARARTHRQLTIERRLPDLLMSLSAGLRAGHGFLAALQSASDEMDTPLTVPIHQLLAETGLGAPVEEALDRFAASVGNADVDMLVTAILIHRRVGGNLAEILDRIGETTRERMQLRMNLRTLTAQGRMSAVIVSLLPVGVTLVLAVISPQMFHILVSDPLGRLVMVVAVVLELMGILTVRRIVNIRF